jgi:hypothetical protein
VSCHELWIGNARKSANKQPAGTKEQTQMNFLPRSLRRKMKAHVNAFVLLALLLFQSKLVDGRAYVTMTRGICERDHGTIDDCWFNDDISDEKKVRLGISVAIFLTATLLCP